MTNANPGPEEAPAPPTSTGWSEEDDTHADELAPPFMPGGAEPGAEAGPGPAPEPATAPEEGTPEAAEPAPEPLAAPFEPAAATEEAGGDDHDEEPAEPFPFETSWDAGEEETAEPEDEDAFPVEAFDIEDDEASWGTEPDLVEEGAGPGEAAAVGEETGQVEADAESVESREMAAAREVAGRLEEMARRLRDQGPDAAWKGLESADRFTSLLAGMLAGYLAGKE